jgi:hypothetical protein
MKNLLLLTCISIIALAACKQPANKKSAATNVEQVNTQQEFSTAEKIARQHGIDNWSDVNSIEFSFNVDRGVSHTPRSFVWNVKTGEVETTGNDGTVSYNRNEINDSTAMAVDRYFINDSYWLLAPFKIVWDENKFIIESDNKEKAPISGKEMGKLTVAYGDSGGYTPGDAYDFYFDDSYTIREWVYRRGGQQEPSMITTWEDYQEIGGLKLSMMRNDITETFKIYFTDVKIN